MEQKLNSYKINYSENFKRAEVIVEATDSFSAMFAFNKEHKCATVNSVKRVK